MHGYELRKRVSALLGWGRVLSYGSLYPALKQMRRAGWLTEDVPPGQDGPTGDAGGRSTGTRAARTPSARAGSRSAARSAATAKTTTGRRGKIVYKLTAEGKERFE